MSPCRRPQYVVYLVEFLGAFMGTDRTISSPGVTVLSRGDKASLCSFAPPRYTKSTLPTSHAAVPMFLTFQPVVNFSSGENAPLLLGDCQINLQASALCTVGVGAGEGTCMVGVGDGAGPALAGDGEDAGVSSVTVEAGGVREGERVRLGIFEGDGVAALSRAGERVRLASLEEAAIGVLLRTGTGADSATQAIKESARLARSSAFLIVVFPAKSFLSASSPLRPTRSRPWGQVYSLWAARPAPGNFNSGMAAILLFSGAVQVCPALPPSAFVPISAPGTYGAQFQVGMLVRRVHLAKPLDVS